jgi:hypothetical protein
MPYIKIERRSELNCGARCLTAGELNYELTRDVLEYLNGDYNYQRINDAIGALECCKLELYRRLVVPYETKKILENGDVYLA